MWVGWVRWRWRWVWGLRWWRCRWRWRIRRGRVVRRGPRIRLRRRIRRRLRRRDRDRQSRRGVRRALAVAVRGRIRLIRRIRQRVRRFPRARERRGSVSSVSDGDSTAVAGGRDSAARLPGSAGSSARAGRPESVVAGVVDEAEVVGNVGAVGASPRPARVVDVDSPVAVDDSPVVADGPASGSEAVDVVEAAPVAAPPVMSAAVSGRVSGLGGSVLAWLGGGADGDGPAAAPLAWTALAAARRELGGVSRPVNPAAAVSTGAPVDPSAVSSVSGVGAPSASAIGGWQPGSILRFFVGNGTADNPNAGILLGNGYSYTGVRRGVHHGCVQRWQRGSDRSGR